MRQPLEILAGTLIIVGTTTVCGGATTGDSPSPTGPPITDRPLVNDQRSDSAEADCPKQMIVSHVPGHTETVWMLDCSTKRDAHQPPSGQD